MSYKICGQGPVTVPGCDSDSCEAIVAQAKVELREEFQASQEAQSEELKQFVGDSVSESDQSIRDDFASSQETQTNELMQAIATAVDNDVDYNNISNKPAVNGVTLQGNKTLEELGIYEVTPEQAAAAEQAQEILEESAEILDRVSSFGRKQFDQTTVTEGPTSQITFEPPGYVYSSTDTYSVYVNGLRLTDDEYSREDNVITLTEPIADAGQKVEIVVLTYPVLPVAAEVMDARVGADGETYPSLGDAIRDQVGDLQTTKANIDGYYEEMTVGDAEQLISTQFVEDSEPYLFRPTGGSADVGNREYLDKIVGGTVAWNQMISIYGSDGSKTENGVTFQDNRDGTYTVSTDSNGATGNAFLALSPVNITQGHKYFWSSTPKGGSLNTYYSYITKNVQGGSDVGNGSILLGSGSGNGYIVPVYVKSGTVIATPIVFKPICIDLTAMFGSIIADYIYSLEQSQAGAGVAWFRNYFTKDYYPYDPGTLRSVEGVSAHETVGFNQWDEEWELGTISISTGQNASATNKIRSKNYIPVIPSTAYFISGTASAADTDYVYFYDGDKTFISATSFWHSTTQVTEPFTTPNNCRYVRFILRDTESPHDICINLSDPTRNGEYEPYVKHTYPLDSSLTLRGIPKLVDGKLAYDGDVYPPSGEVQRRYGLRAYQSGDESLADAITDGTNTVYKLATPTTEQAEPYQNLQICDDWGTEAFVTDSIVPVGHETRYPANLRDKLQHLPDLPSPLIDGAYMVMVSGSQMHLERFLIPDAPTEDGTYTLKATVSGGTPTYTWEVEA